MSANVFGAKKFIPTAPDKGSFPLDHEGEYWTAHTSNFLVGNVEKQKFKH